jgi:hypothetical protein
MWSNFFAAGGSGMYVTSLLGFLLMAASVRYALQPEERMARLAVLLGGVTLASGLLNAVIGVCSSMHFLPQVEQKSQLEVLALGCEESLHGVVLALLLLVLAGLLAAVGSLRSGADRREVSGVVS